MKGGRLSLNNHIHFDFKRRRKADRI